MKGINETLLVSVCLNSDDTGVLIVGKQNRKGGIDIVNAFQGEEAIELYTKLTTKPERTS